MKKVGQISFLSTISLVDLVAKYLMFNIMSFFYSQLCWILGSCVTSLFRKRGFAI